MSVAVSSVYIYNGVDAVPYAATHVRVDPSVTIIPERAFAERWKLEVVELPEGLVRIQDQAFEKCQNLKRINISSTVQEIRYYAFSECEKLEVVMLSEGLRSLRQEAFCQCKSLQRIHIPSTILTIERASFYGCHSLTNVSFSEGLQRIKKDAFSSCKSLESVTLPSSLKVIGEEAFEGCERLNEVHMPDTIENIEARAFKNCNFTNFRMPPSLNVVDVSIVGDNTSLVSLELPETVERLDDNYDNTEEQYTGLSVRNIALPSNFVADAMETVTLTIYNCTDFAVALSDNDNTITDALKHRFDDLPIHKICYYQSYYDNETTMQNLKREINPWTSKFTGQLNKTGKHQDCLGMTPLHILACSTKPTIEMYRMLIEKYPETLIMKDKWGDIPLLYVTWCNAPTEVLDLLVESYKSLHQEYEFKWGSMLRTLAKRDVPVASIQTLINTQQSSFPDQEYDMQQIVIDLASSDANRAVLYKPYTSMETFRYLLRASITKRLDSLNVTRFCEEMENVISALPLGSKSRVRDTQAVYDRLAIYELIKEGTSVLELALWKAKIDESCNKRARVGRDINYKEQCRINCGADIIIRNVLPYLLPK